MYIIPVEAKKKRTEKHISQLSQYMGTLVNGRYVGGCTVGMLIDHSTVRLAFSPLATNDRQWPLPIIFVSSALQWRVGIRLNECVCIAMSLSPCPYLTTLGMKGQLPTSQNGGCFWGEKHGPKQTKSRRRQ